MGLAYSGPNSKVLLLLLNKVKQTTRLREALNRHCHGIKEEQEHKSWIFLGVNALQLRGLGSDFKATHTGQCEPAPTVVP